MVWSSFLFSGQPHREGAALAQGALHRDGASCHLQDAQHQRQAKADELEVLGEQLTEATKQAIGQNIGNAAGIYLLKQNYYQMELDELEPLMAQIPAQFAQDADIVRIKDNVEKMKATAPGQKFTDFEMQTPDG